MNATAQRITFVHRTWFVVLVSGLIAFYALEKTMRATDNPNYLPSVIMLGTFLVPVTLVTYVYERVPMSEIPLPPVAISFLWGGATGVVLAGLLEYETLRDLGPLKMLGVGLIEESAKLVVPVLLFLYGRYRSELAGLLFGVAAGMGFAALETMGYGFVALLQSRGDIGVLEETLLIRGLLSPAGHAAWTGLVCATLWRERLRAGHAVVSRPVIGAFLLAVILHALWDTFNSLRGPTFIDWLGIELLSLAVAVTSLTLLVRRLREATHPVMPETVRRDQPATG